MIIGAGSGERLPPAVIRRSAPFVTAGRIFATKMRDNGVPLDRIQEFLGHKTMAMVLRYAKARPKQLQEAIKKI